jgi:hypothetical protein
MQQLAVGTAWQAVAPLQEQQQPLLMWMSSCRGS